jgi:hypothetical protein
MPHALCPVLFALRPALCAKWGRGTEERDEGRFCHAPCPMLFAMCFLLCALRSVPSGDEGRKKGTSYTVEFQTKLSK